MTLDPSPNLVARACGLERIAVAEELLALRTWSGLGLGLGLGLGFGLELLANQASKDAKVSIADLKAADEAEAVLRERDEAAAKQRSHTQAQLKEHEP